ncbi:MAG: hypothetical protein WEC41_06765 [Dongiaceae bacterium]
MNKAKRPFLDRPAARWLAVLCAVAALGVLGYIHRDDLFPPEDLGLAADPAFAECYGPRAVDADKMLRENVIDEAQATLFKSRAEAFCIAQTQDDAGGPPPLPGQ